MNHARHSCVHFTFSHTLKQKLLYFVLQCVWMHLDGTYMFVFVHWGYIIDKTPEMLQCLINMRGNAEDKRSVANTEDHFITISSPCSSLSGYSN